MEHGTDFADSLFSQIEPLPNFGIKVATKLLQSESLPNFGTELATKLLQIKPAGIFGTKFAGGESKIELLSGSGTKVALCKPELLSPGTKVALCKPELLSPGTKVAHSKNHASAATPQKNARNMPSLSNSDLSQLRYTLNALQSGLPKTVPTKNVYQNESTFPCLNYRIPRITQPQPASDAQTELPSPRSAAGKASELSWHRFCNKHNTGDTTA